LVLRGQEYPVKILEYHKIAPFHDRIKIAPFHDRSKFAPFHDRSKFAPFHDRIKFAPFHDRIKFAPFHDRHPDQGVLLVLQGQEYPVKILEYHQEVKSQ
jgi:hypothetical protein